MSTIALKGKYFMIGAKKKSVFKEFVEAYRENQAEVICGVLGVSGNPSAALRMYQLLSKQVIRDDAKERKEEWQYKNWYCHSSFLIAADSVGANKVGFLIKKRP